MGRRYTLYCPLGPVAYSRRDATVKQQSDIRRYGEAVRRHGWRIAVLMLVSAALTMLVGALTPETYSSSALVGIIDRSNVTAFDPRFLPIERDLPTFEPYPALASSEAVLRDLLTALGDDAPGDGSLEALRGRLTAALSADKVLLRLAATADSPQEAIRLADAWAEVVVAHASALYEATDAALLAWYDGLLDEARAELAAARDALVAHDVAVAQQGLAGELSTLQRETSLLEDELAALHAIQRDAKAARDAAEQPTEASEQALGATVAALQQRVLLPLGDISPSPELWPEDPLVALDTVDRVAAQRVQEIEATLAGERARAKDLETAMVTQAAARDDLALALREAQDRVLLLAGEQEKVRLAANDSRIKVELTSPATLPTRPSSGGVRPVAAGVAAVAGLALGCALAIWAAERRSRKDAASAEL